MKDTIHSIVEKAKSAQIISNEMYDLVERFFLNLLSQQINYSYIIDINIKNQLNNSLNLMSLYESGLFVADKEENFGNFCRYAHLQIEAMLNFYYEFLLKDNVSTLSEKYKYMRISKLEIACSINYKSFKIDLENLEELKVSLGDTKEESEKQAKEKEIQFIREKYKNPIRNYLRSTSQLEMYIEADDATVIRNGLQIERLEDSIKTINKKGINSIHKIPFANKFELFSYQEDSIDDIVFKSVKTLNDYRNKVLSHSGQGGTLNKTTKDFIEKKNYGAVKDSIIEISTIINKFILTKQIV